MDEILLAHQFGILLNVYVQPNSATTKFAGRYLDRLKLKVSAKALDGAANRETCKFIASYFSVAKSCVQIVRGIRSREKTVQITGNVDHLVKLAAVLLR
jgi:uncharacterized protein (TIGR00251 family)